MSDRESQEVESFYWFLGQDWRRATATGSATLAALGPDDRVLGEAHVRVDGGDNPVVFLDNIRSWSRGAASAIIDELGQRFPAHALQGGAIEMHDDDGVVWLARRATEGARFPHERPCLEGKSCDCLSRILDESKDRGLQDHSPGLSDRPRPEVNEYQGIRQRAPI